MCLSLTELGAGLDATSGWWKTAVSHGQRRSGSSPWGGGRRWSRRRMVPARRGLIVHVSCWAAQRYGGNVVYGLAKAATDRMASDMAHQHQPHGVTVVSLVRRFRRLAPKRVGRGGGCAGGRLRLHRRRWPSAESTDVGRHLTLAVQPPCAVDGGRGDRGRPRLKQERWAGSEHAVGPRGRSIGGGRSGPRVESTAGSSASSEAALYRAATSHRHPARHG